MLFGHKSLYYKDVLDVKKTLLKYEYAPQREKAQSADTHVHRGRGEGGDYPRDCTATKPLRHVSYPFFVKNLAGRTTLIWSIQLVQRNSSRVPW